MNKIKVAAVSPQVFVGDPIQNARMIITESKDAAFEGASLVSFPKFALTGCTCDSLFDQLALFDKVHDAIELIRKETKNLDIVIAYGFPEILDDGTIDSCANVIYKGETIGSIMSSVLCFDFTLPENKDISCYITFDNDVNESDIVINMCEGKAYIGSCTDRSNDTVRLSQNGSLIITVCSGYGESTNDYVSNGFKCIAQGGKILSKGCANKAKTIYAEVDLDELNAKKTFETDLIETEYFDQMPYLSSSNTAHDLKQGFNFQVRALRDRLEKTGIEAAVLGISGGLDSTLALLVTCSAFDALELDRKNITAITMPCFGTTSKTLNLALRLMKSLKVTSRQIDISKAVEDHLKLIGHDLNDKNVAYENAQVRERTQILMDVANDVNGLVVGTGDMSEAALGFCTYGGDALSMYNPNAGVPKTLVRLFVKNYADNSSDEVLKKTLYEILDLPISPELLSNGDDISQKTEDILGPYLLHDYIMYHFLWGETPTDIFQHAIVDFEDTYDSETILKTLKTFYIRFFSNQFKRETMADGPQIIDVSLSARCGFNMPSDINGKIWLEELENL